MSVRSYQLSAIAQASKLLDEVVPDVALKLGISEPITRRLIDEYAYRVEGLTEISPHTIEMMTDLALRKLAKKEVRKIDNPRPPKLKAPVPKPPMHLVRKALREAVHPRKIVFGKTEKDKFHPDSPNYLPKFTTTEAFNEHVASAVEPHAINLIKYISKERGLAAPSDTQIKKAVHSVDWAEAAYFTKDGAPSPTKLRLFLKKYIATPLSKVVMGFPAEEVIFAVQSLAMAKAMYMGLNYLIKNDAYTKTAKAMFDRIDRAFWRRVVYRWR